MTTPLDDCAALAIAILSHIPPRIARRSLAAGTWFLGAAYTVESKSCPIKSGLQFQDPKLDENKMTDYIARLSAYEAGVHEEYRRLNQLLKSEPFGLGLSRLSESQVKAALEKAAQ